jgi:hypothetical protein
MTPLLLLVVALVSTRADDVPLLMEQANALSEFYRAVNCKNETTCPRLGSDRICPELAEGEYSARLDCDNGYVTTIGIYENEILGNGSLSNIGPMLKVLTRLQVLYVMDHGENVSGTIPTEIGLLTDLENLNVGYNGIHGTLPTQIGDIGDSLLEIRIQGTQLSGSIPTQFSRLTKLRFLHLDHNRLGGVVPLLRAFPPAAQNVAMSDSTFQCLVVSSASSESNCLSSCTNEPRCCASRLCGPKWNTTTTTRTVTTTKPATMTSRTMATTTSTTARPTTTSRGDDDHHKRDDIVDNGDDSRREIFDIDRV